MSELLELEIEYSMSREQAANKLRELADSLSRHNQVQFLNLGKRVSIDVADTVSLELEYELEDGDSEIEIKISW